MPLRARASHSSPSTAGTSVSSGWAEQGAGDWQLSAHWTPRTEWSEVFDRSVICLRVSRGQRQHPSRWVCIVVVYLTHISLLDPPNSSPTGMIITFLQAPARSFTCCAFMLWPYLFLWLIILMVVSSGQDYSTSIEINGAMAGICSMKRSWPRPCAGKDHWIKEESKYYPSGSK